MQSQGRLRLINQNRKWKKVSVITYIFFHQKPKKKKCEKCSNQFSFIFTFQANYARKQKVRQLNRQTSIPVEKLMFLFSQLLLKRFWKFVVKDKLDKSLRYIYSKFVKHKCKDVKKLRKLYCWHFHVIFCSTLSITFRHILSKHLRKSSFGSWVILNFWVLRNHKYILIFDW